jgi:hypothetical protein
MKSVFAMIAGVCLCGAAFAEPIDDARAIVGITVNEAQFVAVFDGLGDLMLASLQNEFSKQGKTISDDAGRVYVEMLSDNMVEGLTEKMREPLAQAYAANISADALSAYRAFLETEEGLEVAGILPVLVQEGQKIGEQLAPAVAADATRRTLADMEAGTWPDGTLKTTRNELLAMFGAPPISEDPPER